MANATDAELIRRSLKDPTAFESVFERHYDAVRVFAQRLVGLSEGEDIAAQSFETAYAIRSQFDGERFSSARPWLIGIANNIAHHHFRAERTRREGAKRVPVNLDEAPAFRPEAEDARRQGPAIRLALDQLDFETRDTFLVFALGDLSYIEVAQVIGIPVGTVRSRIHRARKVLRELLDAERAIAERTERDIPT